MTSASELFYNRRSRINRSAASASSAGDLGLEFEWTGDRSLHFWHHQRRRHSHRHDLDGCDPLSRSPHLRLHRFSHSEHPSASPDQSYWPSAPSNTTNLEPQRNVRRHGFSASERLPGSVLLARERLLERLRGASFSGDRRSSRELRRMIRNEHLFDDHWRLADASDWETEMSIQFISSGSHLNSSTSLSEQTTSTGMKKPPGLSQDALDQLHLEIFIYSDKGKECMAERKSQDCSICLESFMEGDKLISLPCNHTFHSDCLDPWVRICGDCPYCRNVIIVPTC